MLRIFCRLTTEELRAPLERGWVIFAATADVANLAGVAGDTVGFAVVAGVAAFAGAGGM
jgi:hypothetical protein